MSKETHSFSVETACEVGERGAIMLQHFLFLQRVFAANEKKEVPDIWVRRSIEELKVTYRYLSTKQIRTVLDNLIDEEYLFEKIDNEAKYDRAKSYQLTAKGFISLGENAFAQMGKWKRPNGQMELTERENDILPNGQMNNSYTNYNPISSLISNNVENENLGENPFDGLPGYECKVLSLDVSKKEDAPGEIIAFLNKLTGSFFKETSKATKSIIAARIKEKYTLDDLKLVVSHKCDQWLESATMSEYLRPQTLFGKEKFEAYLIAAKKWDSQGRPKTIANSQQGKFNQPNPTIKDVTIDNFTKGAFQ